MLQHEGNFSKEADLVLSTFGEPSTMQLETARKTIEHARKLCQTSMMLRWESAALQRAAHEIRQDASVLCQEVKTHISILLTSCSLSPSKETDPTIVYQNTPSNRTDNFRKQERQIDILAILP